MPRSLMVFIFAFTLTRDSLEVCNSEERHRERRREKEEGSGDESGEEHYNSATAYRELRTCDGVPCSVLLSNDVAFTV